MNRAEALEHYRSLPLPDTSMEAWRFTDLRGFDPDSFAQNGQDRGQPPAVSGRNMLEIDVSGLATAAGGTVEIDKLPDGIEFAVLPEDHERLGTLVGADDKFTAHNAASWQSGLLVRVPKGVELDDPLYVRVVGDETGATFWRLLVVAEEGSRFSLIEEYTSPSAERCGLHEQRRRAVRRAGREARVRVASEPLPGDLELRHPSRNRRPRRRARLGGRRLRLPPRQGPDPQRPGRPGSDVARHRGVLRGRHAASRLRHLPAAPRARRRPPTSPSRASCARRRASCGGG